MSGEGRGAPGAGDTLGRGDMKAGGKGLHSKRRRVMTRCVRACFTPPALRHGRDTWTLLLISDRMLCKCKFFSNVRHVSCDRHVRSLQNMQFVLPAHVAVSDHKQAQSLYLHSTAVPGRGDDLGRRNRFSRRRTGGQTGGYLNLRAEWRRSAITGMRQNWDNNSSQH
jgi:hypothetical protein